MTQPLGQGCSIDLQAQNGLECTWVTPGAHRHDAMISTRPSGPRGRLSRSIGRRTHRRTSGLLAHVALGAEHSLERIEAPGGPSGAGSWHSDRPGAPSGHRGRPSRSHPHRHRGPAASRARCCRERRCHPRRVGCYRGSQEHPRGTRPASWPGLRWAGAPRLGAASCLDPGQDRAGPWMEWPRKKRNSPSCSRRPALVDLASSAARRARTVPCPS